MSQVTEKQFKPQTEQFYASVRTEYKRMSGIKKNGKQVFSQDYILDELGAKFFRSPKTIENIVFNRVAPKKPTPVNHIILNRSVTL